MKPLGISINQLARDLDVPPNRISAIVNGARAITADRALRLGTCFGVSPETWLGLQLEYDLRLTRQRASQKILQSSQAAGAASNRRGTPGHCAGRARLTTGADHSIPHPG